MCIFRPKIDRSTPNGAVISALDDFWPMFINNRSLCCYLPEKMLGVDRFIPGNFFQATTPYSHVQFQAPLTVEVRLMHNRIGAWANENCLIRLWAILESHGFTKPIREDVRNFEIVKLLKRLRQHFAHGTGIYDDSKKGHRKLRKDLLNVFPVPGNPSEIPLDIDCVLLPMFKYCSQYVDDVLEKEQNI